jgi:hypothetical protein
MDMFDGVGRRRDQKSGQLVNIGEHTLNGFERDFLLRNNGDGTFTDVAYVNQSDRIEDGRGVAIFDYDLDGHIDVALRNYRQPAQLLHNRGGTEHWIELKLVGTRSNRDAVGARVTLMASGQRQTREVHAGSAYLSGSSLVQHFGLGSAERIDEIHVRWPSGEETTLTDLRVDRQFMLREGETQALEVKTWRDPLAAAAADGSIPTASEAHLEADGRIDPLARKLSDSTHRPAPRCPSASRLHRSPPGAPAESAPGGPAAPYARYAARHPSARRFPDAR